jgi:hypothetical protein
MPGLPPLLDAPDNDDDDDDVSLSETTTRQ